MAIHEYYGQFDTKITPAVRGAVYDSVRGICSYSGAVQSRTAFHVDHVLPRGLDSTEIRDDFIEQGSELTTSFGDHPVDGIIDYLLLYTRDNLLNYVVSNPSVNIRKSNSLLSLTQVRSLLARGELQAPSLAARMSRSVEGISHFMQEGCVEFSRAYLLGGTTYYGVDLHELTQLPNSEDACLFEKIISCTDRRILLKYTAPSRVEAHYSSDDGRLFNWFRKRPTIDWRLHIPSHSNLADFGFENVDPSKIMGLLGKLDFSVIRRGRRHVPLISDFYLHKNDPKIMMHPDWCIGVELPDEQYRIRLELISLVKNISQMQN